MRADLWRYVVLLAYGGLYADVDARAVLPVSRWLPPKDRAAEGLRYGGQYDNMEWSSCAFLAGLENKEHFCQWVRG